MHALVAVLFACVLNAGANEPVRALMLGDSIMQAVSRSLERQLNARDGVQASSFTHIGTGLARLDLYDWHRTISVLVEERAPDTVIIMMGANDNQPMRTGGTVVRPGTDDWEQEYARRVGEAMDRMLRGGVSRVYWIELPDMRDSRLQADVTQINRLVQSEAGKRPQVYFEESRSWLSRTPGEYSPYIIQENGMPLDIRAGDGIHLNRSGADFLATRLISSIWGN